MLKHVENTAMQPSGTLRMMETLKPGRWASFQFGGRVAWAARYGVVGLGLLGGCVGVEGRFVAEDLEMFSPFRVELERDYRRFEADEHMDPAGVFSNDTWIRLIPSEKFACRWPEAAEATMNGQPIEVVQIGSGPAAGCMGPSFFVGTERGAVDGPDDVPPELTGDAELIFSDESSTFVTHVESFWEHRELVLVDPPATISPGSDLTFRWDSEYEDLTDLYWLQIHYEFFDERNSDTFTFSSNDVEAPEHTVTFSSVNQAAGEGGIRWFGYTSAPCESDIPECTAAIESSGFIPIGYSP